MGVGRAHEYAEGFVRQVEVIDKAAGAGELLPLCATVADGVSALRH